MKKSINMMLKDTLLACRSDARNRPVTGKVLNVCRSYLRSAQRFGLRNTSIRNLKIKDQKINEFPVF